MKFVKYFIIIGLLQAMTLVNAQTGTNPCTQPPGGDTTGMVCPQWDSSACAFIERAIKDGCGVLKCPDQVDADKTACCDKGASPKPYNPSTESCCGDFTGDSVFGLSITSDEGPVAPSGGKGVTAGNCSYSLKASATVTVQLAGFDVGSKSFEVTGATVSVSKDDSGKYTSMSFNWSGPKEQLFHDNKIKVTLDKLDLSAAAGAINYSGTANLHFDVLEDIKLSGSVPCVLKKGASGTLTVTYKSDGSMEPVFTVGALEIDVVKEKPAGGEPDVLAKFTAESNQSDPKVVKGQFKATGLKYTAGNVNLTLTTFNCSGSVDLASCGITIEKGDMAATVEFPGDSDSVGKNHLTGIIKLAGKFDGSSFSGAADIPAGTPLHFGAGTLYGHVDGKLTPAFDVDSVRGALDLKYDNLTTAILKVTSFEYSGGKLNTLNVSKAKAKYGSAAIIEFDDASWDSGTEMVTFNSAHLSFGSAKVTLDVENFVLDLSDAERPAITVGKFDGDADFDRLTAHISGSIEPDEFKASVDAEFMEVKLSGAIGMGKATIPGTTDSYNWGLAAVSFSEANGVQMGDLPVKLQKLTGDAGYNEKHSVSNNTWTPSKGAFVLGAGAGFCDSLKIVEIDGHIEVQLSDSSPEVNIGGNIKYPATGNRYIVGTVNAKYVLGASNITGTASSELRIPAGTSGGGIVTMNSGTVNFDVGSQQVTVSANNLDGHLLNVFLVNGNFNMSGQPGNASTFGGALNVSLKSSGSKSFSYDNSDKTFGVSASLAWSLSGDLNLSVASNDFSCHTSATFNANATGYIYYESSILGKIDYSGSASVECNATLDKNSGDRAVKVSGDFKFYYNGIHIGDASVSNYQLN